MPRPKTDWDNVEILAKRLHSELLAMKPKSEEIFILAIAVFCHTLIIELEQTETAFDTHVISTISDAIASYPPFADRLVRRA